MRKLTILVLLISAGFLSFLLVNTIKNKPAQGKVEVEVVKTEDPMINDQGGVDGTTVENSDTAESTQTTSTVVVLDTPEVVKEVKEIFKPLPFDGKIKSLIKRFGGTKFKLKGTKFEKFFGKGAKAAKVGKDIYVVKKDGTLYVVHNNRPIKL